MAMASQEHLEILKRGVDAWNRWRQENPEIVPKLAEADFGAISLTRMDLNRADLYGANLIGTRLSGADLCGADLRGARLISADLVHADISRANLGWAILSQANLAGANLSCTELSLADFNHALLSGADFSDSKMFSTVLGGVDLSSVRGLETVRHGAPSTIGIDTIYLSQGRIPEAFLRGAGVPESFITFMKSLVVNPIEYHSCFISYSSKDEEFAKRLYADLQREGVRCWYAPEDLKIGAETRTGIDEAIRVHDKLLIVLSADSIRSAWVKKEVESAFEKEQKQNRIVLFPIQLDGAVMETDKAWAADIRRMRNIGNFQNWKDHDAYQKALERLMRDLKAGEQST